MERDILEKLTEHLSEKEFTIIVGARQTGKSTVLSQLAEYCKRRNIPTVSINLEDKNMLFEMDKHPLNILNYLSTLSGADKKKKTVVLIDEVQYLKDPSNFLKLLYDEYHDKIKIVATGSSAFYIDRKFIDSLAGRKKIFYLFTCSFGEFLRMKNMDDLYAEYLHIKQNIKAKTLSITEMRVCFEEYIQFGGYPAVITEKTEENKIERLRDLRDSFVKRDILEADIRDEKSFYNTFRVLASQTGGLVNVNEISRTLGIKNDTLSRYLYILQKCFHISLSKPYSNNLRNEIVKMPKVFLLDTGMKNILLNNFNTIRQRQDSGEIWENMIYRELCRTYTADNVFFWRTTQGNEVDFIISPDAGDTFAIEAKFHQRQISESKYKKFMERYPEISLRYKCYEPFDEGVFGWF
ncbi:MAG: ATP-binding protein [Bacteroidales bacterium]|jgi:predicted AAA+ superfamily ATPase|nr:ATP-binding protein [Bacteroidales bacterium]